MATVCHLGLLKVGNFNCRSGSKAQCVIMPNFVPIGQTVAETEPIFDFSRWWPSVILDLFYACWDHPRRVFGGLCDCAKFGGNRRSNFDSMQVSIFCTLRLKMPIHAPKIVFWGFDPQNGEQYERVPKRHFLAWKHVLWRIDHQNQTTGAGTARAKE